MRGHLLLPPYVDPHRHLDYVYTSRSEGALSATGTLFEGRELGEKSVHRTVELAGNHGKLIDVHCDETDGSMSRFVEFLNSLVVTEGIGSRSIASHTCSFGSADDAYTFRLMRLFQKSGLNFVANPTENAYLQGWDDSYPKRRGRYLDLITYDGPRH